MNLCIATCTLISSVLWSYTLWHAVPVHSFLVCSLINVYDMFLVRFLKPCLIHSTPSQNMWHCLNLIYPWQHHKKSLQRLMHLLLVSSLTLSPEIDDIILSDNKGHIHNRLSQTSLPIPISSFITMHQSPLCRQCVCCYHGLLHFQAWASCLSVVYWIFFITFSSRRTTPFLQSLPMFWASCNHF